MTTHNTSPDFDAKPLFPPVYLLLIAGAGFLVALYVWLTQSTSEIEFWGGIGVGVVCLLAWALMAPEQVRALLTGRGFQYGTVGIVVAVAIIVALIFIYVVIRQQNIQQNFSATSPLILTDQAKEVVATLSSDPTTPPMKIIGFFDSTQGGQRDRISALLDEFERASNGRISYEFINPDRQPLIAETYGARAGQFAVAPLKEDGTPDNENAELVASPSQQTIIDALLTASASGDFRAYFLRLDNAPDFNGSTATDGNILKTELEERYKWQTQVVSLLELQEILAGTDRAADGDVVVIAGGTTALPDEQLKVITDYVDAGGNLVLLAGVNLEGGQSLATADNISTYLGEKFGVRFTNEIVFDAQNSLQSVIDIVTSSFSAEQYITQPFDTQMAVIMSAPHPVEIAETAPSGVTVTTLSSTFESAYTKADLNFSGGAVSQDAILQQPTDRTGAIPVAASAENTQTGARVVLVGSESLIYNQFKQLDPLGVKNSEMALRTVFWAAGYNEFRTISSVTLVAPQTIPLFLLPEQINVINIVSTLVLPFGILGIGFLMWWLRREHEAAA